MANYNIIVHSITKTASGFSGTFSLSDNEFLVSTDGGKNLSRASATVKSGVDTIVYDGTLRPKISGTQGQRKDALAEAWAGDQPVMVQWTQGHRGAVSSAFMAVWNELQASLEVGEPLEVNKTNPKGGRSGGAAPVMAIDSGLQSKLDQQAAELAELMAVVAALVADKKK